MRQALAPALVALLAFGLRLWWAAPFASNPAWSDPDGYLQLAAMLADGSHGWHWTRAAVEYAEFFKAPLYQTALSALTAPGSAVLDAPRWTLVGWLRPSRCWRGH